MEQREERTDSFVNSRWIGALWIRVDRCFVGFVVDQEEWCSNLAVGSGVISLQPDLEVLEDALVLLDDDENGFLLESSRKPS